MFDNARLSGLRPLVGRCLGWTRPRLVSAGGTRLPRLHWAGRRLRPAEWHPMTPLGGIRAPHGRSAPRGRWARLPASHSADEHVLGFYERVPGGKKKFTYGIIGRTRPPVRTRYAYTMASRQRRAVMGPTRCQRLSGPPRRIGRFVVGPTPELCGFFVAHPKTMRERWRSSCSTWGYL